jgi:hypothetical protein
MLRRQTETGEFEPRLCSGLQLTGQHSSCADTGSDPPTLETAAQVAHLAFP